MLTVHCLVTPGFSTGEMSYTMRPSSGRSMIARFYDRQAEHFLSRPRSGRGAPWGALAPRRKPAAGHAHPAGNPTAVSALLRLKLERRRE